MIIGIVNMYPDLDPDTLTEHLVPPPELHLLIGQVTTSSGNFLLPGEGLMIGLSM